MVANLHVESIMTSWRAATVGAFLVLGLWAPGPASAQQPSDLAGSWTLNRQLSQFPQEVGFSASFIPPPEPGAGRGRGRRSREGGTGNLPPRLLTQTEEDSSRVRFLTDEVRLPPNRLTIVVTPATVTITPDPGAVRTLQQGKRDESVVIGPVTAVTNSAWETGRLVVVYRAEQSRLLRYSYSVSRNPSQLTVDVEFIEQGTVGDKVRRVYEPTPPEAPAATTSTAAGSTPPAPAAAAGAAPSGLPAPLGSREPASPPPTRSLRDLTSGAFPASPSSAAAGAVDERPDAALKGLTRLSVVVEGLGSQATKCGLKQEAVEAAVTARLTEAGIRVVRESDDDTYLYVNLGTVTTSAGLCVTRYDVTLYSHAAGRLPHTPSAVPLQAELLHRGGLTGGNAAAHPDTVLKSVVEDVDTVATRIRAANQ